MWKTKKFIVAMVLVAVVLVGGTAGIALAQGPEGKPGSSSLMARVAEILGINQQDLENAFKQAASEQRKQMSESRLQNLVNEGKITQQQADNLEAWQAAKPDVPRLGGWLIVGGEKADALLQKLLADGKITQAQVDSYKKWLESRPDVQLPTPEGGKRPGRGFFPGQRSAPQSIPFGPRTGSTI